jgi:hypothetical protein
MKYPFTSSATDVPKAESCVISHLMTRSRRQASLKGKCEKVERWLIVDVSGWIKKWISDFQN